MKKVLAIILFALTVTAFAMIPDKTDRIIALTTLAVLSISMLAATFWDQIPTYWGSVKFLALVLFSLVLFVGDWLRIKLSTITDRRTDDEGLKVMSDHFKEEAPLGIGA